MKKEDFFQIIDEETFFELSKEFTDLDIKKSQEKIDSDEKESWLALISQALAEVGLGYIRERKEECDIIHIRARAFPYSTSIQIDHFYELMEDEIPPLALAHAIKAGLLWPKGFKFWIEESESNDSKD